MKPHDYDHTEPMPESEMIRADIEHTRESMDHTLYEIGEKMKPRHMFDKVLEFLHLKSANGHPGNGHRPQPSNAAGRAAQAVTGVVRDHPIPLLLISTGVAWAIYEARQRPSQPTASRRRVEDDEYAAATHWPETEDGMTCPPGELSGSPENAEEGWAAAQEGEESGPSAARKMKEKVKEKVTEAGQQLQEKARKVKERASESARALGQKAVQVKNQIGHQAQHTYEVGRQKFVETSQSHPLSVGLGFLAAGALIGLALPPSRQEDELVGRAADRVKDRAKDKGGDLMERGRHVAKAAADAAKRSAADEGLTPQALQEKVQHIASETKQAAEQTVRQESRPTQPTPVY